MVILSGIIEQGLHALPLTLRLLFLWRGFSFRYFDVVLLCQPAQGLRVAHLLVLHQKSSSIAALSRAEVLENVLGRCYIEGRGPLIGKRAIGLKAGACLLQGHKIPNYFLDLSSFQDLVNDSLWNHKMVLIDL